MDTESEGLTPLEDDSVLYDIAREVTDQTLGEGSYARINQGNGDPKVQAAIKRGSS